MGVWFSDVVVGVGVDVVSGMLCEVVVGVGSDDVDVVEVEVGAASVDETGDELS